MSQPSRALEGIPVLVVEDHPASARMLAALLGAAGAVVKIADSAEAALVALLDFRPRLLLVDLVLPGDSGIGLVIQLKADPKTQGIVCIAMTVVNGPELARAAKDAGCVAYIRKPFDTDTLAASLAKHLEGMK